MAKLNGDEVLLSGLTKEQFLRSALQFIDADACPVCDTDFAPNELKQLIEEKLKAYQKALKTKGELEQAILPIINSMQQFAKALKGVEDYGSLLEPKIDATQITNYRATEAETIKTIQKLIPFTEVIALLASTTTLPKNIQEVIENISNAIAKIPEPTEQDVAKEYLIRCEEHLNMHKEISSRHKKSQDQATISKKIFETYTKTSTDFLNEIYQKVEKDFSEYYRLVNHDDEGSFTAKLVPSMGKLGFDVDFYGRGHFPPGAYHSEGHQDGMGLCLYLALMKHLEGALFSFAVLDDVLMSVDSGHRREVCNLLKAKFPDTQFVLTTHDEIWLRHMKSVGLIARKGSIHFRKWQIDQGPTEWDDRDIWSEINDAIAKDDIRNASALLRHYLEYISAEICHQLKAPVEFNGDNQFDLGDLLPAAIGKYKSLLREAKAAANSWNKQDLVLKIASIESEFNNKMAAQEVERWQVNSAVHYNHWATLKKNDFEPVARAYHDLINAFHCSDCSSLMYLIPPKGNRDTLRCQCGSFNLNLRPKGK
jgi:hypothetical protein